MDLNIVGSSSSSSSQIRSALRKSSRTTRRRPDRPRRRDVVEIDEKEMTMMDSPSGTTTVDTTKTDDASSSHVNFSPTVSTTVVTVTPTTNDSSTRISPLGRSTSPNADTFESSSLTIAEQRRRQRSSFSSSSSHRHFVGVVDVVGRGSRVDDILGGVRLDESDFIDMVDDIDLKWYRYSWSFILGAAGFLDIMVFAYPNIRTFGGCGEFLLWPSSTDFVPVGTNGRSVFCSVWVPFMQWLETYDVMISFIFSILWAIRSFLQAKENQHQFEVNRDRRRILKQQRQQHQEHHNEQPSPENPRSVTSSTDGIEEDNKQGQYLKNFFSTRMKLTPRIVYYQHVFSQFILLPVGFYVILYNMMLKVYTDGKVLGLLDELNDANGTQIILQVYDEEEDRQTEYETFTERSKLALIFALAKHVYLSFLTITAIAKTAFIQLIRRHALRNVRPLLTRAVRNPFKSRRQFRAIMRYVRYTKYSVSLVGGVNKLNTHYGDFLKRYKQKKIADKQRSVRKSLWAEKTKEMREVDAAILIQSVYRSHRARRYRRALLLLQKDRKAIAAAKIQAQLRRKLANARIELMRKRRELKFLQHKQKTKPDDLIDEDRRRLYELQDEFAEEADRIINRTMLLYPNTKFAIAWKLLFVIAIGVEVSQKAVAPWLKTTGKRMPLREFAANAFIPTPVSQNPDCNLKLVKKTTFFHKVFHPRRNDKVKKEVELEDYASDAIPWRCYEPFSFWWDSLHDTIALLLTPAPMKEWPECQDHKPATIRQRFAGLFARKDQNRQPRNTWYCYEPYSSMQTIYRWLVDGLMDDFVILVSIVCFFDVFVTFFTGEVDELSGDLVPKPFFNRWIAPGLLIQLLLNPAIDTLSNMAFATMRDIYEIGPVRVWRWIVTVFLPIAYGFSKGIQILALQQVPPNDKIVVEYRLKKRM